MFPAIFINRLKEFLVSEENLTQIAVSQATNISPSNLNEYLSGKHLPDFQNFVSLLEFFSCSADYLLGLTDIPSNEEKLLPVPPFPDTNAITSLNAASPPFYRSVPL